MRRGLALACAVIATAPAGCGLGGDDEPDSKGSEATAAGAAAKEVRTTRVEVVEGLGDRGSFDPGALYERLSPGVVTVLSLFEDGPIRLGEDGGEGGQGSGFVLDGEGYVATNAHVVTTGEGRARKRASQVYVEFSDGNRVRARIIGDDPNADVALLKIDPAGLDLTPLELGRSRDLAVGAPVAAIGSPFGERQSLSVGVVSAVDRSIDSLNAQFAIGGAIQTDAAINPGNSGGPLLNGRGQVLGINSQIKTQSGSGAGVGFAVPVDTVRRSLRELRDDGEVNYGYLGVTSQPLYPQLAQRLDVDGEGGALVVEIASNSPAAESDLSAGEKTIDFQGQQDVPADGDVILAVDDQRITLENDLADLISRRSAGDEVELRVLRDGDQRTVKIELGERPGVGR